MHNDSTFAARFDAHEIEWASDGALVPASLPIPPCPRPAVSFAKDAMSATELRSNAVDAFAAMREVDTRPVTTGQIRRMMSERYRSAA